MTAPEKRGFAALHPDRRREIAAAAGRASQASGRGHRFTSEEAAAAGAKGGAVLASRPGYMAELGRRGGAATSADREHMADIGSRGGAVVASKPGHMTEIGRAGGKASQARKRAGSEGS